MANYPQLDNASGVWNLREVYDAVMGGYWPNANAIGLIFGGEAPSASTLIQKVNVATTGDATVFGDLSAAVQNSGGYGSFIRGVRTGGYSPSYQDTIDYVTFTTEGNAADFGNLSQARASMGSISN